MSVATHDIPEEGFYVLVTGANSGLGFAIGCRLIDEFLQTRPQSQTLVLIITTRSPHKGADTLHRLEQHLRDVSRKSERKIPGISMLLQRRVQLRQEILDLTNIISIQRLSSKLRREIPKLDAVILNAGIGGWTGLNWPKAVWTVLTDWVNATTWPEYKLSGVGWTTKPQIPPSESGNNVEEPPLGEVFCANVFGHYLFGHYLAPLLANHSESDEYTGRLIWLSSLDAYAYTFDFNDFQAIGSNMPYESTKRLTDTLGITARLKSTSPFLRTYLNSTDSGKKQQPKIYIAHPGICATSILPLVFILDFAMTAAFYLARWLGSQWHAVTPSNGAVAPVWLALAKQSTLDAMEESEGVGKWGSAVDRWGHERVERTEVEGWGWGGKVEEYRRKRKGRWPGAVDTTEEKKVEFEELGAKCWQKMEELRKEWEGRLKEAGVAEIEE